MTIVKEHDTEYLNEDRARGGTSFRCFTRFAGIGNQHSRRQICPLNILSSARLNIDRPQGAARLNEEQTRFPCPNGRRWRVGKSSNDISNDHFFRISREERMQKTRMLEEEIKRRPMPIKTRTRATWWRSPSNRNAHSYFDRRYDPRLDRDRPSWNRIDTREWWSSTYWR